MYCYHGFVLARNVFQRQAIQEHVMRLAHMQRFDDILEDLHHCTVLYTGENTLSSIHLFLYGYSFAAHRHGITLEGDPLLVPRAFNDWVAYRLQFYEPTSGWCHMIGNRTDTEQDAIDKFFELLKEFKSRQPHVVARLIGLKRTYQKSTTYLDEDGKEVSTPYVTLNYPSSISLVTYTNNTGFFAHSDTEETFPSEGYFPDLSAFELRTGSDRSMLTIIDEDWDPKPFQRLER